MGLRDLVGVGLLVACGGSDGPAAAERDAAPPSAPVCGYWSAPSTSLSRSCTDVDKLVLSNPTVDGAGAVPGQTATVRLTMTNNAAHAYNLPCVALSSGDSRVTLSPNPSVSVYLLAPGASAVFTALASVGSPVPSGAVVHLAALTGVPSPGCTNGGKLEWDVAVK